MDDRRCSHLQGSGHPQTETAGMTKILGISECIALAKAHEEETEKVPVLDADFAEDAEDVEEILSHRKPWNPPAWE